MGEVLTGTTYVLSTLLISYVIYIAKGYGNSDKKKKLKVMSCRKQIKSFKKLDESDKNSLF